MRSNKLQSAGQMRNVKCVSGAEVPVSAAWSVLHARQKSTKRHTQAHLT